ncbi:MAG: phage portal protein [Robiginitomaculum sp.]|nr:MAG: phage portal protein [Robiginitomaculum sp.]
MKNWLQAAFVRSPQTKSNTNSAMPLVALQLAHSAHSGHSAQWTPRNYAALAREGYQQNAIAYRCIRLIAEAAASVPLCVRNDNECIGDNPAVRLLRKPSPKISRAEFFETFYSYLHLSGDSFLEAVVVDGRLVALFNLRPDRMRAVTDHKGWPTGWDYEVGSKKRRFTTDPNSGRSLIHHARLFHPTDDIYGFSPLAAAAKAIDVHNAGGVWTKALLDNSARPSGALIYKGTSGSEHLSAEQFERLKSELDGKHSGAGAAGRPLLLEGGLDWKAMSMSPTDMDFLNARREAAREIALAFGVPPMLLGIPGDNTYANYKEANLAFWRQTILPLVRKTADSLGTWLADWYGDDLRIIADEDAIPALTLERAARWKALNDITFMSAVEKRERAGLPIEVVQ